MIGYHGMQIEASRLAYLISALETASQDGDLVEKVLRNCVLHRRDAEPRSKAFTYEKEALFVRDACDALGDVTFGASAGIRWQESNSLTGYISKYSKDLRAAIENTARFHDLIDPAVSYSLVISGNSASFDVKWKNASYAKYHRHTEFIMFGVLSRMRAITQTNFYPIELRLDHEVGVSSEKFIKLAGFPIVFGAESPEIILSLSSLNIPIPTYDLRLREHLSEYGEKLLQERSEPQQQLRKRVESMLMIALPGHVLPAEEVAANMGMSSRTFARRLKNDGESYRGIVDDLRSDLAKTLLKDGMSFSNIAFALGYADQAVFSTAFKRWTGSSPKAFRSTSFQN